MIHQFSVSLLTVALMTSLVHGDPGRTVEGTVDFRNDLVPVFTKLGCNSGACHGAAVGRGGFKLSLYGGDPTADHEAIARQLEGRRIDLADPGSSLVLLKPTEHLEHGGGKLMESDGEGARMLREWIRQGAKMDSARRLRGVEVSPSRHVAGEAGSVVKLAASARFDDGTRRDVTEWTVFKAEDESAVEINEQTAEAIVKRPGRHIVVARYLHEVVPIEFLLPMNNQSAGEAPAGPRHQETGPTNSFIDQEIAETLRELGLPASRRADDATFIRRLTLDLTGRLPTKEASLAFLSDDSKLPRFPSDKYDRAIRRLLDSDEFSEYWTLQMAKLLRLRPRRDDPAGAPIYHRWLKNQVRDDVGFDALATQLVLAQGDTHQNGPANFYRMTGGPREQAEFVSELFMGSRLRCANCHNHPLDRWTQDDYHGLAAIFAKVDTGPVVRPKPTGKVIHPRTLEAALERIPGERFLVGNDADARREFIDWLVDEQNPYFAKSIVNRLWKSMMGRGLVEPVDDFRGTNPATHPALLERLAKDFVDNGYSIRHSLGVIARSDAYARSSDATTGNEDDDRFYSHMLAKPLEPEVLADAISDVLLAPDQFGDLPSGTRAVALMDPKTESRTLDVLGRCGREMSCETASMTTAGLPQKLHLFNGALLNARLRTPGGRLSRGLTAGRSPLAIIENFYQVALGREPRTKEREHWQTELDRLDTEPQRVAFLEDFVWGLVTCNEFRMNH